MFSPRLSALCFVCRADTPSKESYKISGVVVFRINSEFGEKRRPKM